MTVPPSEDTDDRNNTFLRRLTRLPNLILWTPALAQFAVLINDLQTLKVADYLSPLVNRTETAIAVYLFIYILYQTIKCFALMARTNLEWVQAWNEFSPKPKRVKPPTHRFSRWARGRRLTIASILLAVVVLAHALDEWQPHLPHPVRQAFQNLWELWSNHVSVIVSLGRWLTTVMLILIAVVFLLGLYRRRHRTTLRLAWTFTVLALLDVLIHNLRAGAEAAQTQFRQHMEGFYSSPLVVIAALFFWFSLRHDHDGAESIREGDAAALDRGVGKTPRTGAPAGRRS